MDKLMARWENNAPENLWMSYLPGRIQGMNPVTWLSPFLVYLQALPLTQWRTWSLVAIKRHGLH